MRYSELPTKRIMELATNGDSEACMELSKRYAKGTPLLEKDAKKAEYWRKKAEGIEIPADTSSSDMVHDIVTDFYDSMWKWYSANGLDCISGKDLDDSTRAILRNNFEIGLDETILFKRDTSFWSNNDQGLVITEEALYCIPDNDDLSSRFVLSWKEFDNVRYNNSSLKIQYTA